MAEETLAGARILVVEDDVLIALELAERRSLHAEIAALVRRTA